MPCDYKKYPTNWKSEIVPAILKRAEQKCERCGVPNKVIICRGIHYGSEVWQDENGIIFYYPSKEQAGQDYVGWIRNAKYVRIVLTVAHLDHNIENNDERNLKALCQMCHNRHDIEHRLVTRKRTMRAKKKQFEIHFNQEP